MDPALSLNSTNLVNFGVSYVQSLPELVMTGDLVAIVVAMIATYVGMVFVHWITKYLIKAFKAIMFLGVANFALYTIITEFLKKMAGASPIYIGLGIIGIFIGFIAVFFAFISAFKKTKKGTVYLSGNKKVKKEEEEEKPKRKKPAPGPSEPTGARELLSWKSIKEGENALTTMFTYILIAEFGVFSSKTISAPSIETGAGLLILFYVGVTIYIFQTYKNPKESLKLLASATVAGFILSLVLGLFWASYPVSELISLAYFKTEALVAFLTGIALSLFMAGRD